ncbi:MULTISPECIES: CYTH domain-containing protein [unclassified Apibacter]|uniref:CYTH domain-containing protein n=1 Tax=unclassified Apibacter TaxID=2630820 RepID=UPI0013219989|nr:MULTISPECIES: CYTH domain-containing protein [unclassified Apibacter]MCX8677140.1 CYTH domain-containing protein [Apibacter sp. B3919]MXO24480.1 CYTH domain-containing protein [Apibacter sp. B3924]MXO25724.1 CYTH domain-containing protein [Apibacter sp. B3813]MXO27675.1 CYTH domain-containing protein [Apibacter sp. B3913]MXO29965.1 CYTH domain-containing protein [Apibacter sp. B3912]
MGQEIERKYLITGEFKSKAIKSLQIKQGYLSSIPERTVRVRIQDNQGFLTIKGSNKKNSISRFEWEKKITKEEANELIQLCEVGIIDKKRYIVPFGNKIIEVDEFYGENEGLILAEIELDDEDETIEKPDWLGKEVTDDPRYYNSMLKKNPYKNWDNK